MLSIQACLELIFLKKLSLLLFFILFYFILFFACSFKESPDFGRSWKNNAVEKQPESSQGGLFCIFPYYGKLMGKAMHLPCGKVYHRMGIWWNKTTFTLWKVWVPTSKPLSIQWILLHFPVLWEIDGETHVIPMWWSILQDGNIIEKSTHTMEKVYKPMSRLSMGFAIFFQAVGIWWENPCISHMMKYTIEYESNGKKAPYYGKSISTNFPGSPNMMCFVAFSCATENW